MNQTYIDYNRVLTDLTNECEKLRAEFHALALLQEKARDEYVNAEAIYKLHNSDCDEIAKSGKTLSSEEAQTQKLAKRHFDEMKYALDVSGMKVNQTERAIKNTDTLIVEIARDFLAANK